ncbi:MAG: hypothetical protein KAI55_04035 [Candidatus Aenigmarchaeota archaeon]|nr:hypothetical protein [Candidatus Aenigmarchaeota archaeon]
MKLKKNRKAIIHVIEGVLSAIIITGYFFYIFTAYDRTLVQKEMFDEKQLENEVYSLLSALKYTDASCFIEDGKSDQINSIFKYFIGIGKGYSLLTEGLPKKTIKIGVVSKDASIISTHSKACTFAPAIAGTVCHGDKIDGVKIAVANVSSIKTNALFISYIGNSYDFDVPEEGPFLQGTTVKIKDNHYGFYIDDETKDILLFNAEDAIKLAEKINMHSFDEDSVFNLNQRKIEFNIRSVSVKESYESLKQNDILFFYGYRNLLFYKPKLEQFIAEGKTLFEITDADFIVDEVQQSLFNLLKSEDINLSDSNNKFGEDVNVTINTEYMDPNILGYLNNNEIALKTKRYYPALEYLAYEDEELNHSIDSRTAFISLININNKTFHIVLVKNSGTYSHMYLSNKTDFTGKPGNTSYNVGDEINIDSYNYTIKSIDPEGRFIKLKNVFKKYIFPQNDNDFTYVYPQLSGLFGSEKFMLFRQNRTYNTTQYDIRETIGNSTNSFTLTEAQARGRGIICPDGNTGYPAKISNISLNPMQSVSSRVQIAIANCSDIPTGIDTFYIDIYPANNLYNNTYEGPFSVFEFDDILRIKSEYYNIKLNATGGFNLTLLKRWSVPVAITNDFQNRGASVWMIDPKNSSDGWGILKSMLAALSYKEEQIILEFPSRRNSLFAEDVFFSEGDFILPYKVKVGVWYP